jgi:putative tricarboxylic transport membrane protein
VTGRDRGAAAVLLVFGLVAFEEATRLRFGSIARPGPGFVPLVLAAAFSLVCVALLVSGRRAPDAGAPDVARLGWPKIVATMAALFVYALVLEPVGFVVATFLLLLFFFRALERQRWLAALAGALLTALVTYLVFKVWLNVQLPAGPWGG